MLRLRIMSVGHILLALTIICRSYCPCYASKQTDEVMIAGLFNAFSYGIDGTPIIHSRQCQHFAAFMMAIDEVNNRNDGLYDDVLDGVHVNMALSPGQSSLISYPSNSYFDGTANAYQIQKSSPSVIGTVITTTVLAEAVASSSSSNAFGSVSMLSTSPSSIFNDAQSFPTTLQIAPTTFGEAFILPDLISVKYKWRNIAIFTSTDVVGIDSYASFVTSSAKTEISIIGSFFISMGINDLTTQIAEAKQSGATIFVLFLDGATTGRLLEQGYNAGLFRKETQVITTSTANIEDIRAAFSPAARKNEANIMQGFITVAPHLEYFYNTPEGQSFISRFRNLPPTIKTDPITKSKSCNIRTLLKSDGTYDYKSSMNSSTFQSLKDGLCLGFESFRSFHQNGSNIDPSVMFTYDAACTYLIAASTLHKYGIPLSAPALYRTIVSYPLLAPVTGYAYFVPGRGTRVVGNVYKLLNYQASGVGSGYSEGKMSFIGERTDRSGWLLCGSETDKASMSALSMSSCSVPLYRSDQATQVPKDAPPDIIEHMGYNFRVALIVFSSLGLLSLGVWGFTLYKFRATKQIKRAQPKVMACFLFGGVLGLVKVILACGPVNDFNCLCQLWLLHLSFRIVYRTLLLKLWRIHAVINAESFKRVTIRQNAVIWYLLIDVLAVIILILVPITVISLSGVGMVGHVISTVANQTTLNPQCQVSRSVGIKFLDIALFISDGLVLLAAIRYAFLTRQVPVSVNETFAVAPGNKKNLVYQFQNNFFSDLDLNDV